MNLSDLLEERLFLMDLKTTNKDDALEEMARFVAGKRENFDCKTLLAAVKSRETLGTTAMGNGVAFPHARVEGFDGLVVAVGVSRKGIEADARDAKPVRLIILLITGMQASELYLPTLAAFASIGRNRERLDQILGAKSPAELKAIFESFDIHIKAVLPSGTR